MLDVRSPGEYEHGHIPGAISFPLFSDAERAEVVTWKDIPQDAAGLAEWRKILSEVFPPEGYGSDPTANTDAEIMAIAKKHGASYLVVDRTRASRIIGLPRLHPDDEPPNPTYAIYLISPPAAP